MRLIKAVCFILILLTVGCDGPKNEATPLQDDTPPTEMENALSLLSKNDKADGIETTGSVFFGENFDFNYVLLDTMNVLNTQYDDNFKFTVFFKNDKSFDELRLSTDEHFDNYFPYQVKNDIYAIEVTKRIIEYFDIDLLEKQRSVEFIVAGFKDNKKATKDFYFTINFLPVFSGKITLSISGLFHDPGDTWVVPNDQEYTGIIHVLNLDSLKSGGYSEYSIYTLPDLNEKLYPYQKNRYDRFEFHEVKVVSTPMSKYLDINISKSKKIVLVRTKF